MSDEKKETKSVKNEKHTPIIRSIDLGWGYTKYSVLDKENNEIVYRSHPSLAPKSNGGQDLSMGLFQKRDTIVINCDGTEYEVGPDSIDLDINDSTRNLNDQYIFTEQYKAVFYGTLAYIDEDVIDLLVVGLPMSGLKNSRKLYDIMKGKHKIQDNREVEVKEVIVLPQPLGGLYHCMSLYEEDKEKYEEFEFLDEEYNLIVDPGFLTYDFLLSNGDKIIENRSSAYNGGMSKVLNSISKSISEKFDIKYENLGAIDKGLKKRKIKINGQVEQLEEHIKNTKSVLEGSVNYMKNMVGDGSDIDNIILIAGGSTVFKRTVEFFYPNHKIHTIPEPQLANVKGYQKAGEDYYRKTIKK